LPVCGSACSLPQSASTAGQPDAVCVLPSCTQPEHMASEPPG
jgi:hypothetical protein